MSEAQHKNYWDLDEISDVRGHRVKLDCEKDVKKI